MEASSTAEATRRVSAARWERVTLEGRSRITPYLVAGLLGAVSVVLPRFGPLGDVVHPDGPWSSGILEGNVVLMLLLLAVSAAVPLAWWPARAMRLALVVALAPVAWVAFITIFRGQGSLFPIAMAVGFVMGAVAAGVGAVIGILVGRLGGRRAPAD